jgi:nucleoside-diphosphate-sugar epimerase
MSKVLVTGATGAVGNHIVQQLGASGRDVRALVRSSHRASTVIPNECELFEGDVTDSDSVRRAVDGCTVVYHAAGVPEQWVEDVTIFDRVNVGGTRNVVQAALEAHVKRFVYTSTIDVFAAESGEPFDESRLASDPKPTAYERSKQEADRIVSAALEHGLAAVFLHPAGVYGPAPGTSEGVNGFVARLLRGKMPILLPGAVPLVLAEDCGRGHVLAEEKAPIGARYILCETTVTLAELAEYVTREASIAKRPPVIPVGFARAVSTVGELASRFTHKPPLIPEGQLQFLLWNARPVSRRAREELRWAPTPLALGLRRTIEFLRESGRA